MLFEIIIGILYLFMILLFLMLLAIGSVGLTLGVCFLLIKFVGWILNKIIK